MTLSQRVNTDITAAMKAQDQRRLSALRMLKAAIMNKGVEKGRDLDDTEVLQVVSTLVKQRRDNLHDLGVVEVVSLLNPFVHDRGLEHP